MPTPAGTDGFLITDRGLVELSPRQTELAWAIETLDRTMLQACPQGFVRPQLTGEGKLMQQLKDPYPRGFLVEVLPGCSRRPISRRRAAGLRLPRFELPP